MPLRLKSSAEMSGMQPELVPLLIVANEVYKAHGYDCVVTSCTDSKHSNISLHYPGFALDFRTIALGIEQVEATEIASEIRSRLGGIDYDIVVEGNHIHGEFQPKWRDS